MVIASHGLHAKANLGSFGGLQKGEGAGEGVRQVRVGRAELKDDGTSVGRCEATNGTVGASLLDERRLRIGEREHSLKMRNDVVREERAAVDRRPVMPASSWIEAKDERQRVGLFP